MTRVLSLQEEKERSCMFADELAKMEVKLREQLKTNGSLKLQLAAEEDRYKVHCRAVLQRRLRSAGEDHYQVQDRFCRYQSRRATTRYIVDYVEQYTDLRSPEEDHILSVELLFPQTQN